MNERQSKNDSGETKNSAHREIEAFGHDDERHRKCEQQECRRLYANVDEIRTRGKARCEESKSDAEQKEQEGYAGNSGGESHCMSHKCRNISVRENRPSFEEARLRQSNNATLPQSNRRSGGRADTRRIGMLDLPGSRRLLCDSVALLDRRDPPLLKGGVVGQL